MSAESANLSSSALKLMQHVPQLLTSGHIGRSYMAVQVLESVKKVHFWCGLIPDETYDPEQPLYLRPEVGTFLPLYPWEWTPEQTEWAESLIDEYGLELEKTNILLQFQRATFGPVYACANADVRCNFITG